VDTVSPEVETASANAPWALELVEAAQLIRARDLSARALVEATLDRLEATEPHVRAFTLVDRDGAVAAAARLDRSLINGGPRGPLHGVPVAVKDIFDVAGMPTRCGSDACADAAAADRDSDVVGRLRAAGAVVVGKTATHELACGVYTPPTRNPWDLERSAGGSSGGSAAALAAGAAMGALGSDTGGSVRIPAALCGVVGIKPTYDLVSRRGVATLSWSLDHVGPLARTVADAALLLAVIAGAPDGAPDATSDGGSDGAESFPHAAGGLAGRRIGVVREVFFDGIDPEVVTVFDQACALLADLGADLVDVSIPELAFASAAEYAIILPEAAAYHERLLAERAERIGDEVRDLLEAGRLLPAGTYVRAQRTRAALKTAFRDAYDRASLDAVAVPTVPAPAQRMDQANFRFDAGEEAVASAFVRTTAPFNLTGQPVVALQAGMSAAGLPIGIQFAGRPFGEANLIRLASTFEQALAWTAEHGPPRALAAAMKATGAAGVDPTGEA
jgi:aspartyl-tRNA(Asn)/glutamyl-tRNA(Gln) amidotransferase subunit A